MQDAAACLPPRLLGDVTGLTVADLCAAPGGKTAMLAAGGARVTAVDHSARRLERLSRNLARLGLEAEVVTADVATYAGGPFDAVLLDAPCSATGTIRRHPDVAFLKGEGDIAELAAQQRRMLERAIDLVKPGGLLVYCTCSLEPEEGEAQIRRVLADGLPVERVPVDPAEIGGLADAVTAEGDVRTLPSMLPNADPRLAGLDGFFIARLRRL
ncbi:Ribosomal RNA small subunit methyltransferase B [Methylobrevis pamukkalensis]|uniref:Ribosomal RNA small subunit methyltransferase B n=1 Tax=Methylobrevis pamukkalensis TaxID=1439726 RepID=A0A1E3H6W5_9HYPH|nr:Ribosomal RNA small subunit methyltransferase B [Methylobrevis pamukkalensis]